MSLEELVKARQKAIVLGVGGGGDVVGTIPTSRCLRTLGLTTIVGGLTWERYVNDPEPGPRKLDEIEDLKLVSKTVGLANKNTKTTKGVKFTESVVAEFLGEETLLVDLNEGVQGVIEGLNEAIEKLDVDLFVGIDVGGDILASGQEEGLHSMLADSMMLSVMCFLKVPTVLGVLGGGADGELTFDQFITQLSKVAKYGGLLGARGLTPGDVETLEKLIPKTKTESSALAVKAAKGVVGEIPIRGGYRKVWLSPLSAITFYLDPKVVFEKVNLVAKKLVSSKSLDEAQVVLEKSGVPSELTFERNYVWKQFAENDELMRRQMG